MNLEDSQTEADEAWLEESLKLYAVSQDSHLRNEIANRASWIAMRSARRFWDKGEPFDDLVQVAHIGLLKAIDRFDPSLGVQFGAYATPTIIGELRRHFRDYTWSVHVPRRTKDIRGAVNVAKENLTRELRRSPTVSEIAAHIGMSADSVIGALEANNAYRSYTLDPAGRDSVVQAESNFDDVLNREVISTLLDRLSPRERKILHLRYFEELNQEQIAERIGTSQVHIGRLIKSSLAELRRHLADEAKDSAE